MRERYHHHGWNLSDDDVPCPPECSPVDSAQRKRWIKSLQGDCREALARIFFLWPASTSWMGWIG